MTPARRVVLHLAVVTAIMVAAFSPLVIGLAAGTLAESQGCVLDESGVHPCQVMGHEVGELLLNLALLIWLAIVTVPLGVVAVLVYLVVVALVALVRRARREPARWEGPR